MFANKDKYQQKQQAKASLQKLVRKTVQDVKQNHNRSSSNLRKFINDKTVKNQLQIERILMSSTSQKNKQKKNSKGRSSSKIIKQIKDDSKCLFAKQGHNISNSNKNELYNFNYKNITEPSNLSIQVGQFDTSFIDNASNRKNTESQYIILKSINNTIPMAQQTPKINNHQISFEKNNEIQYQRKNGDSYKKNTNNKTASNNSICKNCFYLQNLYQQEISMIRKYCDYVKQENKKLREKLYALLSEQVEESKMEQITVFSKKNEDYQTKFEIQKRSKNIDQNDDAAGQLYIAKQKLQSVNKQLRIHAEQNQYFKNQLKTKNLQIQALGEQILVLKSFINQRQNECESLRKENQNLQQSGCNTEIYNETIQQIMKMNQRILQQNRHLRQQKSQIQHLCQQISRSSIEKQYVNQIKYKWGQKQHQMSFQQLFNQNCIQLIKKAMLAKIQLNTKPLEEQIQLLKQVFQGQKKKFQQKQINLKKLLQNAQNTIKGLMQELVNTKKQAKVQYLTNLDKQRQKKGINAWYRQQNSNENQNLAIQ